MSGILCSPYSFLVLWLLIIFIYGFDETTGFLKQALIVGKKNVKKIIGKAKSMNNDSKESVILLPDAGKVLDQELEQVQEVPQVILQPEQSEQSVEERMVEEFNNDLYNPSVDIDAGDYESTLKNMVLEPTVFEQHKKFGQELMHRVGGTSSRNPVRDDNIDVVPWVGLRRPEYQKIDPNDGTARVVPSVKNADDLANYQQIMWKHAV